MAPIRRRLDPYTCGGARLYQFALRDRLAAPSARTDRSGSYDGGSPPARAGVSPKHHAPGALQLRRLATRGKASESMPDPELPPDSELIQGIRSGDPRVLARLQTAYWGRLVQFADRILDGGSDPQDVVQEAFIRLWTHRERWSPEGSVRSLLYTVTRNAALDERRRGARRAKATLSVDPPAGRDGPADDAVADELLRAAADAVSRLPPKRQEVFRLAREEGLTYAEIARVLEVSPQTVANQMSLALGDLRRALAAYLEEEAPSR